MATGLEEVRCPYCAKLLFKVEEGRQLGTNVEIVCTGCKAKLLVYPPGHIQILAEPKRDVRPPRRIGPTEFK